MMILSTITVGLVAILHLYFLILEMFLWDKPMGLKVFGHSKKSAEATKVLAANQGLYNGFIAAGLLWGILRGTEGFEFQIFFLLCVIIAGIYAAFTVNRKILYIQALPAFIALVLVVLTK